MRHWTVIIGLLTALALAGCENGLGNSADIAGTYVELTAPSHTLGAYANVEVGSFSDAFVGHTPDELLALLPDRILAYLDQAEVPTRRSGKTLVIEGTIIYYEAAGPAGGGLSAFEEAVAEVQLLDKDSGQIVATAHCIGRSTTFMSKGAAEKADRLGKSIAAWVAEHYPKRPDIEEE